MIIYTAPAFRASAAKPTTEQAKTRPVTFSGNGETVKHTLTDSQFAAWDSATDDAARAAILASAKRRVMGTGKVQITVAALAAWQERVRVECDALNAAALDALPEKERDAFVPVTPAQHAASILASGVVVLDDSADDDTDEVLAGLFS